MLWQHYVMNDHCPEYEKLTIEEKLLVNAGMREWFANTSLQELCVPMFIFREAERRIIEEFKRKDKKMDKEKELKKKIQELKNKMKVCSYGKEELFELENLERELNELGME